MFDLDWIRRLIELVDESDVDSLEISRFGTRIVLSKSPPVTARLSVADIGTDPAPSLSGSSQPSSPVVAPSSGPVDGGNAAAETAAAGPVEELFEISSPMVGTFYRAPAPDAPSYVEVGDRVEKGQTLCILEAMKLMNELESEVAGVIREIPVQNAEPVEYGQVLFRIALNGAR